MASRVALDTMPPSARFLPCPPDPSTRRLFEKQARWAFPQLQKQTNQPTMYLKEVLGEIAVKNPRGPYKDLWELKKGGRAEGARLQRRGCCWAGCGGARGRLGPCSPPCSHVAATFPSPL